MNSSFAQDSSINYTDNDWYIAESQIPTRFREAEFSTYFNDSRYYHPSLETGDVYIWSFEVIYDTNETVISGYIRLRMGYGSGSNVTAPKFGEFQLFYGSGIITRARMKRPSVPFSSQTYRSFNYLNNEMHELLNPVYQCDEDYHGEGGCGIMEKNPPVDYRTLNENDQYSPQTSDFGLRYSRHVEDPNTGYYKSFIKSKSGILLKMETNFPVTTNKGDQSYLVKIELTTPGYLRYAQELSIGTPILILIILPIALYRDRLIEEIKKIV